MSIPEPTHRKTDTPACYDPLAALFKASGDPLRLEILRILGRDTYGVMELAAIFSLKQSAMSHHLKVLAKAELVETQREGNSIFYRRPLLNDEDYLSQAKLCLFSVIDQIQVSSQGQAGIEKVRQQRSEQSQAFFARNAAQFKKQQELIADFPLYANPMATLIKQKIAGANLPASEKTALEIGPGEGGFLATLSELFATVVAVDNSETMLTKALQTKTSMALTNVELILGTSADLINQQRLFDLIVMNMVLHHVSSPAALIADCARLLTPGGMLFVSDLSKHHQSWTRETCGDLWLGFDAAEISDWAKQAGLANGESIFLGVRNGFQIQLRQFIKTHEAFVKNQNP